MTIGDVLAVIAAVTAVGASWGATLLLAALAFPARARRAQQRLETAPGRCLGRGLGVLVVVGSLALGLAQSHAGPIRIVAGALCAGLVAVAALGGAGIVRLLGERIESAGGMTPFAALTRGAFLFVTAGFLPIIGWFVVAPVALLMALGAGSAVLRGPVRARQPLPAASSVTAAPVLARACATAVTSAVDVAGLETVS